MEASHGVKEEDKAKEKPTFEVIEELIRKQDVEQLKELLELHPTIIKLTNYYQDTPLITAAGCNTLEIVQLLLEYNADLYAVDDSGQNAFHSSAIQGSVDVLKYFLELDKSLIYTTTAYGQNALHLSTRSGQDETLSVLEYLLKTDSGLINNVNKNKETPLYIASYFGEVDFVRLLLTYEEIDVNVKCQFGSTSHDDACKVCRGGNKEEKI